MHYVDSKNENGTFRSDYAGTDYAEASRAFDSVVLGTRRTVTWYWNHPSGCDQQVLGSRIVTGRL